MDDLPDGEGGGLSSAIELKVGSSVMFRDCDTTSERRSAECVRLAR